MDKNYLEDIKKFNRDILDDPLKSIDMLISIYTNCGFDVSIIENLKEKRNRILRENKLKRIIK